jgi:hypothetical protein
MPAVAMVCAAIILAACGAGRSRAATTQSSGAARVAAVIAGVKHIYANEIDGRRASEGLAFVASDQALLEAISGGDLTAAQVTAQLLMTTNPVLHLTRIAVVANGRAVVNAVWNSNGSFVSAPVTRPLTYRGRRLGTVLVSVQDVVGLIKLIGRDLGAQAVIRGSSGQVRASTPAVAAANLPDAGTVTISGISYYVGSLHLNGWRNELLTVWVLTPA